MTMKELAKLANVSVSTVSKAFNEANDINQATKNRIFEIAKQYGCFGKFYRGKYHKKTIAIICQEFGSSYYTRFINIFQYLIEKDNGICLVSVDNFSASKQSELIEYYSSYLKVDGIIVFCLNSKLKRGYKTPIVSLFSSVDPNVDSVNTDINSTIREAVNTLKTFGHKNVAFFGERLTEQKSARFVKFAEQILDDYKVFESKERFERVGKDCARQLLKSKSSCTAIICAYDNIAFGAIKELKKNGYKIPDDFSVIGIDNISFSEYTDIPLTTIDAGAAEICEIAWGLLCKKIKNPFFKSLQQITVKSKLILRESVGPAKEKPILEE